MNGFEPLRRRIIDYTEAGQWSEVYDGPLEDCESEKLKAENAKLRELVRDYEHCTMYADCAHCKYDGKLSTHCPLSPCFPDTDELRELGVEVES